MSLPVVVLGLAWVAAAVIGAAVTAFLAGVDRGVQLERGRAERQAAVDIDNTVVQFRRPAPRWTIRPHHGGDPDQPNRARPTAEQRWRLGRQLDDGLDVWGDQ